MAEVFVQLQNRQPCPLRPCPPISPCQSSRVPYRKRPRPLIATANAPLHLLAAALAGPPLATQPTQVPIYGEAEALPPTGPAEQKRPPRQLLSLSGRPQARQNPPTSADQPTAKRQGCRPTNFANPPAKHLVNCPEGGVWGIILVGKVVAPRNTVSLIRDIFFFSRLVWVTPPRNRPSLFTRRSSTALTLTNRTLRATRQQSTHALHNTPAILSLRPNPRRRRQAHPVSSPV